MCAPIGERDYGESHPCAALWEVLFSVSIVHTSLASVAVPALAPSVRTPVTKGRRPIDPPLRLRTMKDATGQNEHNSRERPAGDETLTELMSRYTPRQREAVLKELRILAKVAVRAHMERQASGSRTAPDDEKGGWPPQDPGG